MLKLNSSYSKKVPVEGQDFSSQSYHASVEVELSDALEPQQIQGKIHDTFKIVKEAVENELKNGKAQNGNGQAVNAHTNGNVNGNGNPSKATNKQIKFITDLAVQKGVSLSDLNTDIKKQFGVDGLYNLSSKQASELVDDLKRHKAA